MDKSYTELYVELSEKHWWWRSRNSYILEECQQILTAEESILEIGSGTGVVLKELEKYGSTTGIEPDKSLFAHNRAQNSRIINCTLQEFNSTEQYSMILMLDVLEHIQDDKKALLQVSEMLKKGAHLVINVPAFQSIWTYHDQYNQHYRRYKKQQLEEIIISCGLSICKSRYTFCTLYPLKILTKIKERIITGNLQMPAIPTPIFNNALCSFFKWEHKQINPCFGSSLLLIAKKVN